MPAKYVRPYSKGQKNDFRDAEASDDRRQALPNRDPPDVTRFKPTAAKRVQAHRWRRRLGLRCLTVRVSDRIVRHLISTGYLSLESRRQSRSLLRLGFRTASHEPINRRSQRLATNNPIRKNNYGTTSPLSLLALSRPKS
jgi:hypothetical protein